MVNFRYLITLLAIMSLWSCNNADEPEAPRMVLDAWIDSDGFPVAVVTTSVAPSETDIDLSECLLRWATVTITDGVDTVKMAGTQDEKHFPHYLYKSFYMRGQEGKTYTITAEYRGLKAVATSRILAPPTIKGVEFEPVKDADNLYGAVLTFVPPSAEKCRFVAFVKVTNLATGMTDTQYYPSFLGTVTTETAEPVKMSVFRGKHRALGESYDPNFAKGDRIDIRLCRVEDDVYAFWEDYLNAVYFGHGVFLSSPANLVGNVDGGYGCFSACGTAVTTVTVP